MKTFIYSNPKNVLQLADEQGDVWIEIIRVGNWNNSYKQFEVTIEHLSDFIDHFERNVLNYSDKKIPLNYAHEQWGKAAGWISELKVEGQSLMGKVELTSEARERVRDGEWKYISAEIAWEHTDQESGVVTKNVLLGAALTNIPFVRNMKSVEASDAQHQNQKENQFILLSHDMNIEQQLADERAKTSTLSESLTAEQSKVSQLSEQVQEMQTQLSEEKQARESAETALAEMRSAARTQKETARVEQLLTEGKILPAQKEETLSLLTSLLEEQAETVFTTLASAGAKVDLDGEQGSGGSDSLSAFEAYESFSKEYLAENAGANATQVLSAFAESHPEKAKEL